MFSLPSPQPLAVPSHTRTSPVGKKQWAGTASVVFWVIESDKFHFII